MATKITTGLIDSGAITSALITDASITADDLHTTLDLTGKTVTVATATAGDNDTSVASTAFVSTAIANLADSAPSTLNTLNELAAALGDDANFSTTVTNSIAAKLPLAGGTLTGNLLIGTTDAGYPAYGDELTIGSASGNNGMTIRSGTSNYGTFYFSDATGNGAGTYAGKLQYNHSDNSMRLATNSLDRLTIDSSGNVGIGTVSPARELHIHDPSSDNVYLMLSNTTSGIGTGDGFQLFTDGTNAGVLNRENGYLKFTTNNTDRMTISNAGNVGIGTTSPSTLLHINSTSQVNNRLAIFESDINNLNEYSSISVGSSTLSATFGMMLLSSDTAYVGVGSSGNAFDPTTGSGLYVNANGNVGIGETSPDESLVINGGVKIKGTNYLSFTNTSDQTYIHAAASNVLAFGTNNTERMRISSTGNVGIGTASPAVPLDIQSDSNASAIRIRGRSDDIAEVDFYNNANDSVMARFQVDTGYIATHCGGSERMRIDSSGRVGINRTPAISNSKLEVGGADNVPLINVEASGVTGGMGIGSTGLQLFHGSSARMRIDSAGDVGIGVTSPGKKLDVRGTIRATASNNDISLSDELPGYGANSYGNLKASANHIYLSIGGSYIGYINSSAQLNASDSRLKENVSTLTGALDKVNQLRGVSFNWIDSARGEGTHIGFIAQELEEVYPELVGDGDLPDDEDGQSAIKSVDYGHMVPVLVEAIKELKAENDALKARLDAGGL